MLIPEHLADCPKSNDSFVESKHCNNDTEETLANGFCDQESEGCFYDGGDCYSKYMFGNVLGFGRSIRASLIERFVSFQKIISEIHGGWICEGVHDVENECPGGCQDTDTIHCAQKCLDNHQCQAFTVDLNENVCYMKRSHDCVSAFNWLNVKVTDWIYAYKS